MTAKGRITTANLIEGETRVLVAHLEMLDGTTELRPARKQSGATVARVLEVRAGTRREFETRAPREVVTTAGVVRAYGHETFPLAPETKPAIKAAEIEAYAEDAERATTEVAETVEEAYDAETIEHIERAIDSAIPKTMHWIEKAIDAAYRAGKLSAETRDLLNKRKAYRLAIFTIPDPEDLVQRISDGNVYRVEEVTETTIVLHASLGFGVGVHDLAMFHRNFVIFARNIWRNQIRHCPNEWHRSAPVRRIQLCPECPA